MLRPCLGCGSLSDTARCRRRRDHERELAGLKTKLTESIGVVVGSESPLESDDVLKTLHSELRKSRVPDSLPASRPS